MIGATFASVTLCVRGYAAWDDVLAIWMVWWVRDLAGVFVVAPLVVLWAVDRRRIFSGDTLLASATLYVAAGVVGLFAFSPLIEQSAIRSALCVLAALPLLWAALRCAPANTATTALILSCLALWGTLAGGGPFAQTTVMDSVVPLVIFMSSISLLGLTLSAEIGMRERIESKLRYEEQNVRSMFSQSGRGYRADRYHRTVHARQ